MIYIGSFSTNTKSRSWFVTVHIANMEKTGLIKEDYENPEKLADFLLSTWENSGKDRNAGVAICKSAEGLYHAHVALYGNTTTLSNVAKIMFDSHVEPQMGKKENLRRYIEKQPPYNESGEIVLFSKGLDNIKDNQGNRSDVEEIELLLQAGYTPNQILNEKFAFRKYENHIRSAFIDKRITETPLVKEDMYVEWHVGNSGTGKTYTYVQLCKEYGDENVYMATDFDNGGFDKYIDCGAPPILFLDEFKGNMLYSQLLIILDKYSRSQIHCRYKNTFCLWTKCYISSIYPPEMVYKSMVDNSNRSIDKVKQLLRRINTIVYHYIENGIYMTYSMPTSEYIDYNSLKAKVHSDKDGFMKISDFEETVLPFD